MDPDAAEVYRLDRPQVSPGLFEAIVGQVLICLSYPLAPNCEKDEILRVVVRESLSGDLSRKLIHDILQVYVLIGFPCFKARADFPMAHRTEDLLNDAGPSYSMSTATRRHENLDHGKLDGIDAFHIKVRTTLSALSVSRGSH